MSESPRVRFFERQQLRASDLNAEQQYLLGLAGRHEVGPHQWGIVRGLDLSVEQGVVTIAPGLAIDGHGRELAVTQPVRREFTPNIPRAYVYLYYCEHPKEASGPTLHLRWQDLAEVALSEKPWPVPAGEPRWEIVRAAGSLPDAPPWPILLGCINIQNENDHATESSDAPFTRLRGSRLASPSGRAVMHIGQENVADQYHVRISGRDTMGAMPNRLAFDREGNLDIWGNVTITGVNRVMTIATPVTGLSIKIVAKPTVGPRVLWRTVSGVSDGQPTLELTFRDKSNPDPLKVERHVFRCNQGLVAAITAFSRKSALVTLAVIRKPTRGHEKRSKGASKQRVLQDPMCSAAMSKGESGVSLEGGAVKFGPDESQKDLTPYGCEDTKEIPLSVPEGLVFVPGAVPPESPTRDLYCLRVSALGKPPADELRITGGAFKDGDLSRRFAIGGQHKEPDKVSEFIPWLTMRGDGAIEIIGGGQRQANQLYPMIQVHGTVEPPPVKPDPRDALFKHLLGMAFINGVLSLGPSLLAVEIQVPESIDLSHQTKWFYHLTLRNNHLTEPLVHPQNIVTISGDNNSVSLTKIDNLPAKIPAKTAITIPVEHMTGTIPQGANTVRVSVSVAMGAGSLSVAGQVSSQEITVKGQIT